MWCLQLRRGRRSDRGLDHTVGAVLVEKGDAKAVMQGGTGEVGVLQAPSPGTWCKSREIQSPSVACSIKVSKV